MRLGCAEIRRSIHWLLDDELEAEDSLELEAHVTACTSCRQYLDHELHMRRVVQRAGRLVTAPARLRQQLHEAIAADKRAHSSWRRLWPVAATVVILMSFVWHNSRHGLVHGLEQAALRHSRNLPMDVEAAEWSKVENYFSGKLPFAVHIPQLMAAPINGFGGRVVEFDNRDAAYVRYETPRGRVSMFVYPDSEPAMYEAPDDGVPREKQVVMRRVNGFTAAQWRSSGLVYSVVTDLPETEFSVVLQRSIR